MHLADRAYRGVRSSSAQRAMALPPRSRLFPQLNAERGLSSTGFSDPDAAFLLGEDFGEPGMEKCPDGRMLRERLEVVFELLPVAGELVGGESVHRALRRLVGLGGHRRLVLGIPGVVGLPTTQGGGRRLR